MLGGVWLSHEQFGRLAQPGFTLGEAVAQFVKAVERIMRLKHGLNLAGFNGPIPAGAHVFKFGGNFIQGLLDAPRAQILKALAQETGIIAAVTVAILRLFISAQLLCDILAQEFVHLIAPRS